MTRFSAAAIAALTLIAGCAEPKPAAEPAQAKPAAPPVVEINAADYAFQAPDTIPGGWVTLRIHNGGKELHHATLARLDQGKTLEDLRKLPPEVLPPWLVMVGGPNAAVPGAAIDATVNLTPGAYVLLCVIPSTDLKPHFMKGMLKPVQVVAATAAAEPPPADITIKLVDYSFEFSPELTAGKHTIRVETPAGQPHEILIARLPSGKKAEDLMTWVETMQGPPPVEGIAGGTTPLSAGGAAVFQAELTPGTYAIICFVPDAKDGKYHATHGMMRTISIS